MKLHVQVIYICSDSKLIITMTTQQQEQLIHIYIHITCLCLFCFVFLLNLWVNKIRNVSSSRGRQLRGHAMKHKAAQSRRCAVDRVADPLINNEISENTYMENLWEKKPRTISMTLKQF